jgi:hypothetical protein
MQDITNDENADLFCYKGNTCQITYNDCYLLERQDDIDAREDDHWQQAVAQHRHNSAQSDTRHCH